MSQSWIIDIRPAAQLFDHAYITDTLTHALKEADLTLAFNRKKVAVYVPDEAIIWQFQNSAHMTEQERLIHSLAIINVALADTDFIVVPLEGDTVTRTAALMIHTIGAENITTDRKAAASQLLEDIVARTNAKRGGPK